MRYLMNAYYDNKELEMNTTNNEVVAQCFCLWNLCNFFKCGMN